MVSVYTGVLKFRAKQSLNKIIRTGTSGVQTGYNFKFPKLGTLNGTFTSWLYIFSYT